MAGIRDGPGQAAGRSAQSRAPGYVSSATFQESLHSQARWTTETPGRSGPGRQNRPTRSGNSPQSDLGGGILGVLEGFPAGPKQPGCAGCVVGGVTAEEGEWVVGCGL